ncbi:hypothetical protein PSCT_01181 [Pseudomonas sp. SCT]|uniref:hypothetical protein n=1 Tax=Pseudomonas sp. (strain SCT) TaxID=412955 RepID=UPI000EBEFE47|nr:hypothetical protein [Pseudomonas sp. SCT]GCA55000.1 hypothetical protein PSCT_01181 [Pseudomonas sp. SCT]
MSQESPVARKRRLARERQTNRRQRIAQHRQVMQAEILKLEIYGGTRADLDLVRSRGGFEEDAEALTLGIRYLARLAQTDPDTFAAAMNPRNA